MAHRRVKNIDYDDDDVSDGDYDDGYVEESADAGGELTDYDREQLRTGTESVRQALGPDIDVSEKQIHDALWHYYYDVGKTVTYLKNTVAPPSQAQKSKPKQVSRFDQAASTAAAKSGDSTDSFQDVCSMLLDEDRDANLDPFRDVPWGPVPIERRGIISTTRVRPAGRLLGGASKPPSKLAALAAARKKKEEEKRAAEATSTGGESSDRALSLLGKLGTKKDVPPTARTTAARDTQETKREMSLPTRTKSTGTEKSDQSPLKIPEPSKSPIEPNVRVSSSQVTIPIHAPPSTFAQAIFGSQSLPSQPTFKINRKSPAPEPQSNNAFSFPYMSSLEHTKNNPFAGPSPDDVVLNAQSKAKSLAQPKTQQPANGLAKDVSELSVQDTTKPKHKNLNVLEEFRKAKLKNSASFVVVGHVDHGKSTLMGRLLYDLKVVDEKSLEKLRRESKKIGKSSFALAWVMDATSDERSRGITVDIATNYFETTKTKFTILDAPGHQDFIPNMISGASQANFAVLVIDASTNSFESGLRGQTKEHALLVRSMGVQRLVVAVNKMDMASWSEERYTEIKQQMTAFLAAANFSPKKVSFVPCAGLTGENIVTPVSPEKAPWYKDGPTLVQELDASEPTERALEKPLRLTISELFRSSANNPVSVSGRLDAGSLQVGDVVRILPSGESAAIKSLEADGELQDWAVAGQIATLNLADVDPAHLKVGDIVCHPSSAISSVKSFTAKILTFEHVLPMFVDVHRGPLQAPGRIASLAAVLDKQSGGVVKKKPRVVQPGQVARVVVELEAEMPLEKGGRVVLRMEGRTVASGLVE